MRVFVRLIIGAVFGVASAFVVSPAFAAFRDEESNTAAIALWVVAAGFAVIIWFAPTIRRSLGRAVLLLGVSFLSLPLSMMLLSGRAASEVMATASAEDQVYAAAGAGLAGVAVTGLATFVGLIAGAILIVTGLVLSLGGRREVIVVDHISQDHTSVSKRREPRLR